MPRPIHFEIPATDPEKMMTFFTDAFGWKFEKWPSPVPYWMITTGEKGTPGIDGGVMAKRDPAQPMVNTIDVANLDKTLETIVGLGGTIAVPRMAIPTVGWLAYFKDPEGNIHGVMQADAEAR